MTQEIERRRRPGQPFLLDGVDGRTMAKAIAASGMFATVKDEAQALVKMQLGAEIGISPMAAVTGVHWIQTTDKNGVRRTALELSANLRAQIIKRARPAHDYKIAELNEKICTLIYLRDGQEEDRITYTIEKAQKAGLIREGGAWTRYPEDMVFAAAIRRMSRRCCPELFGAFVPETDAEPILVESTVVDEPRESLEDAIGKRRKLVFALCRDLGWDEERRHQQIRDMFDGRESLNALEPGELDLFIHHLRALVGQMAEDALSGLLPPEEDDLDPLGIAQIPPGNGSGEGGDPPAEAPALADPPDGTLFGEPTKILEGVEIAGIQVIPVVAVGEHLSARTDKQAAKTTQWALLHRKATDAGISLGDVHAMFEVAYQPVKWNQSTQEQTEAFGRWLIAMLKRREVAKT